jgi:acetylglutamate kinase
MNLQIYELLKRSEGKTVRITFDDGEVTIAKVIDVSKEDEDVIYRLISTNRVDRYEKTDIEPTLSASLQSIVSIEGEVA